MAKALRSAGACRPGSGDSTAVSGPMTCRAVSGTRSSGRAGSIGVSASRSAVAICSPAVGSSPQRIRASATNASSTSPARLRSRGWRGHSSYGGRVGPDQGSTLQLSQPSRVDGLLELGLGIRICDSGLLVYDLVDPQGVAGHHSADSTDRRLPDCTLLVG